MAEEAWQEMWFRRTDVGETNEMRVDRRAPPEKVEEEEVEERGNLCDRNVQWPEIAAIVFGGKEKQLKRKNPVVAVGG